MVGYEFANLALRLNPDTNEEFFAAAVTGGSVRANFQASTSDVYQHKRFAKVGLSR